MLFFSSMLCLLLISASTGLPLTTNDLCKVCPETCHLGFAIDANGCPICDRCNDIVEGGMEEETYPEKQHQHYDASGLFKRGALNFPQYQWPKDGCLVLIPFSLGANLTRYQLQSIGKAIQEYKDKTCIRFIPRINEDDYVQFVRANHCSSYLIKTGGMQEVWLDVEGCFKGLLTVLHETMHMLGFIHEHQRPDRNKYITILEENVIPEMLSQFEPFNSSYLNSFDSSYDLDSVMHYNGSTFSRNGKPTIVYKSTNESKFVPPNSTFSANDVFQINMKYNCIDKLAEHAYRCKQEFKNCTDMSWIKQIAKQGDKTSCIEHCNRCKMRADKFACINERKAHSACETVCKEVHCQKFSK